MSLKFEWDPQKAISNFSKHDVSFEETLTAFADPMARLFDDEDHSVEEQREIIIGYSTQGHLLVVCFTARGESIRIFSARKATRRERKEYEENIKS